MWYKLHTRDWGSIAPEVLRTIHIQGYITCESITDDEPISDTIHGSHYQGNKDGFVPFSKLELAVKEYVLHDNSEPLALFYIINQGKLTSKQCKLIQQALAA